MHYKANGLVIDTTALDSLKALKPPNTMPAQSEMKSSVKPKSDVDPLEAMLDDILDS